MPDYSRPIKNTAFVFNISLVDAADTNSAKSAPTLATGDVKVKTDAGSLANITTLPTASGVIVTVSLSASEMNGDSVWVQFIDQTATKEWADFVLEIAPQASSSISADVVSISGDSTAADNAEAFFDGTGYAGTNNVIPTVTTVTDDITGPNEPGAF